MPQQVKRGRFRQGAESYAKGSVPVEGEILRQGISQCPVSKWREPQARHLGLVPVDCSHNRPGFAGGPVSAFPGCIPAFRASDQTASVRLLGRHPDAGKHRLPVQLGEAVRQRKRDGLSVEPELLAHISPLGWAHILLTGECRWPKRR